MSATRPTTRLCLSTKIASMAKRIKSIWTDRHFVITSASPAAILSRPKSPFMRVRNVSARQAFWAMTVFLLLLNIFMKGGLGDLRETTVLQETGRLYLSAGLVKHFLY